MKSTTLLLITGAIVILVVKSASGSTGGSFDLSALDDYGSDRIGPLKDLANELKSRGFSDLQIKLMLSQAMHETGILTDNNYNRNAVEVKHNFAGISPGGTIATYYSVSDFVDAWESILSRGTRPPLDAVSPSDYAQRLKANGYYTDSLDNYSSALNYYFNLF
ncbi:MAG: hypothetical protein ABW007_02140 [Chitinophagaceae bacterium]